ncbi:G5 domain-containing protein, partial [Clostridium paraputrificum]|uniref:G5 domain-containing protein n=1 Tax=Clostridium paraputrificum TaxID=29363 RepID=UPI0012E0D96B
KEETFVTYKGTVQDVLQDKNIAVGVKDKVQPSLESKVSEKETIKIKSAIPVEITANGVQVEKKELVQNEPINFETIVEKDESLDKSVSKVKSEGVNGEKEVTYEVVYRDGVETSRNVTSTKTITEPKNEIVIKGTGQVYA